MHETFDHTADVGVRIRAASLPEVFAEAGEALLGVIAGDTSQVMPREEFHFEIAGSEPGWLLLDWLGELLAAFELRKLLLAAFDVVISPAGLRATVRGERYDPCAARARPRGEGRHPARLRPPPDRHRLGGDVHPRHLSRAPSMPPSPNPRSSHPVTLERLDDCTWRIPRTSRPGMLVDGLIFADDRLIDLVTSDRCCR